MDNSNEFPSIVTSTDIETRIILLKMKAAQADLFRQERDVLISRLKLYNPDWVWPDFGIDKRLDMPSDDQIKLYEENNSKLLSEKNDFLKEIDELVLKNQTLNEHIQSLEQKLTIFGEVNENLKQLNEENYNLKENLKDMEILKEENGKLLIDINQLRDDFEKLLEISGSDDPMKNSKIFIKKLCTRINALSRENTELHNSLFSKQFKIDVLNSKLSQLNAKLNEPYFAIKIKLCNGETLSDEEAYLWAVYNLETINRNINGELRNATEKLDMVTEKYTNLQKTFKSPTIIEKSIETLRSPTTDGKPFDFQKTIRGTFYKFHEDMIRASIHGNYDYYEFYEESEKWSTSPVTRDHSFLSMNEQITPSSTNLKVAILFQETKIMEELSQKLDNLRDFVLDIDETKRLRNEKFFSFAVIPFGQVRPRKTITAHKMSI